MVRCVKSKTWILVCASLSILQSSLAGDSLKKDFATWDLNDVTYIFPVPTEENVSDYLWGSDFIPQKWLTKDLASIDGLHLNLVEKKWIRLVSAEDMRRINEQNAAIERSQQQAWEDYRRRVQEIKNDPTMSEEQKKAKQPQMPQQIQQQHGYELPLPNMTIGDLNSLGDEAFRELKLVAFRIDPCFRDQFLDRCRKQIRAVWQPFHPEILQRQQRFSNGQQQPWAPEYRYVFRDAAVHTFYDLSDADFSDLLRDLIELKSGYGIDTRWLPLGVHPGFTTRSTSPDAFLYSIRKILEKRISSEKISRIAFLQEEEKGFEWRFSSFDVKHGRLKPITPAHLLNSDVYVQFNRWNERTLSEPIPVKDSHPDQIFKSAFGTILDKGKVSTPSVGPVSLRAALRVENPKVHLPGTIDCVSCHVSPQVKERALRSLRDEGDAIVSRFQFQQKGYNKANRYPVTHSQFRALGYTGTDLELSDRVINESAAVAEQLNQMNINSTQTGGLK